MQSRVAIEKERLKLLDRANSYDGVILLDKPYWQKLFRQITRKGTRLTEYDEAFEQRIYDSSEEGQDLGELWGDRWCEEKSVWLVGTMLITYGEILSAVILDDDTVAIYLSRMNANFLHWAIYRETHYIPVDNLWWAPRNRHYQMPLANRVKRPRATTTVRQLAKRNYPELLASCG